MHFSIWLPILAVAFGFITHALSADGGGTVLRKVGINAEIPKGAIPILVLTFGLIASVFENVQNGLDWEESLAKGALASLTAIFGVVASQHFTGRPKDPPAGPNAVVAILLLSALAVGASGCGVFQKVAPYLPGPKEIACAELEADKGTPAADVLLKCGFAEDALAMVESLLAGHKRAKLIRRAQLQREMTDFLESGAQQ